MSTPSPPSRPDLPTLLGLFPPSDFAGFEFLDAAGVAPPYHGLLVHEHHMTVTVEGFYRDFVDVKILARRHEADTYARKILLAWCHGFYNTRRRHSSAALLAPAEFERITADQPAAA